MQQIVQLEIPPADSLDSALLRDHIATLINRESGDITGYQILKRSIDARGRQTRIILLAKAFIDEPFQERDRISFRFQDVGGAKKKAVIIGAGPAGLFAAVKLIEAGIKPILLERGKDVRARRRDLAILNKEGTLNPESNYCFGEGGAGAYSDGKLYTRSTKRGSVARILDLFVRFGAGENILYDAHPHIGTNKLPQIITAMRQLILDCGGMILFEKKAVDFQLAKDLVKSVITADGESFEAEAIILATGHSARDVFHLLHNKKIAIESKPFALGVRIEHPQSIIDGIQYHLGKDSHARSPYLPPASYSLVKQVNGKGVFSFCMCPGGIIAPASTDFGELVVNGWSPSKRNNPFANSGIVINVDKKDLKAFEKSGPLAGMYFQRSVEQKAFLSGGGKFVAPAQRMTDFVEKKISTTLPVCSYLPGLHPAGLDEVLPDFVFRGLQSAFVEFGKKMKGYYTHEAVILATESRTSSPVRIPRDQENLHHPQIKNLYPCGEGAGYAGGIVSAAMDGERVAEKIAEILVR